MCLQKVNTMVEMSGAPKQQQRSVFTDGDAAAQVLSYEVKLRLHTCSLPNVQFSTKAC